LIVMAEEYLDLEQNLYDYMNVIDIRNMFEKLRIDIYDQTSLRLGNKQNLNFQNCRGKNIEFKLSDIAKNLRFPVEFLKKISSTPGLINYSELIKLTEKDFQSKIFAEIEKVLKATTLKQYTRTLLPGKYKANEVPFGILNLNLEKSMVLKNEGVASFQLRKEGGHWLTYHTDQDNHVSMHLPSGRFYLQIAGVLRKTFFMVEGAQVNISIE